MASYLEITRILGVLAACYPQFKLTKQTVDAYARILGDLGADELAAAADQVAAESKFFPAVAELREKVLALRRVDSGLPDAYTAWDEVMREVRRVGYQAWTDTKWSCDLVANMARRFWRDCCMVDVDELATVRAQFRDSYNAQVRRAEDEARRLPGTNEAIKRLAAAMSLPARLNGKHTPEPGPDRDLESEGEH